MSKTTPSKTIDERLREIVVNQLNVSESQVTRQANFTGDLGADSLDEIELVMAVEDEFREDGLSEITLAESEKLKTVGDVLDLLEQKISGVPKQAVEAAKMAFTKEPNRYATGNYSFANQWQAKYERAVRALELISSGAESAQSIATLALKECREIGEERPAK